jgi:ABC-2 type transport system permease protein
VSTTWQAVPGRPQTWREQLGCQTRVVRVIAGAEFKLKYSESALGYVWSVLKPLGIFGVLYVVFGRFFKLNIGFVHYPIYLLIGIVLWSYFADATGLAMWSIVQRASLLRKLAFNRLIIPVSVTLSAAITLCVNLVAVGAFVAGNRIAPTVWWLLIPLLLAELYLFTLGVGLLLTTLFVRFRDFGQIWELLLQMLFYASPIIYPVGFLPPWAKPVAFLSPFVQVVQDVRAIVVPSPQTITAADIYHSPYGRLLPITVMLGVLVLGFLVFRRESPRFPERV